MRTLRFVIAVPFALVAILLLIIAGAIADGRDGIEDFLNRAGI